VVHIRSRTVGLVCCAALAFLAFAMVAASSAPAVITADDPSVSVGPTSPGGQRQQNPVSFSTSPIAPNGDSGWFRGSAPTVTLAAIDPGDSIPALYDWGVNPPASFYVGTFAAPSGQNMLYFLSRDATLEAETVNEQLFKVDTSVAAPVITTPLGDTGSPAQARGVVEVAATATDAVSGVGSVSYFYYDRLSGAWNAVGTLIGSNQISPVRENTYVESWNTSLVPDGLYKLEAQVRDVAGNTNFSTSQFVRVDNSISTISTAPRPR
jgi:hypothetical protein